MGDFDPVSTGAEWTSTSKRAFVTISAHTFFAVGQLVMAGVAYFIRDWRILHLVFSGPVVLGLPAVYWSVHPSVLQCNPKAWFILLRKVLYVG